MSKTIIRRNITVICGDSATGKTALVDMIQEFYENGADSCIDLQFELQSILKCFSIPFGYTVISVRVWIKGNGIHKGNIYIISERGYIFFSNIGGKLV